MKIFVPAVIAAAALAAACDRPPITKSEYNNSGASATAAMPAPTATSGNSPGSDAAPAAAAPTETSTSASVVGDTVTTGKIKAAIAADSGMKDSDISVTTNAGVVTLSGTVKSQDQVTIASNLAQRQEGVQKVETNVAVK